MGKAERRRRRRGFHKHGPPAGSRPGAMAAPAGVRLRIHVIDYTPERVEERDVTDVAELARYRDSKSVTWIEVEDVGDEPTLRRLGELFAVHPLALADVVNVPQRPKAETYDQQELLIGRMVRLVNEEITSEQVSLILGPRWVLTFQEGAEDCFDPVRARIRGGALIRQMGPDFLAYAILDAVIDGYYPVVERLGDSLEAIEDEVVAKPTTLSLRKIHDVRSQLLDFHRTLRQQRDAVNTLLRGESPHISPGIRVYLRDAYDHAVQILDVVEVYREMAVGLLEVYLSSVSQRTNEIVKVLTIMTSIFIPGTFLAGVYGMNFEFMPELHLRWAYPAVLAVMAALILGMVVFFRRRGWIGTPREAPSGSEPTRPPRA
jgi:magnesium transporter